MLHGLLYHSAVFICSACHSFPSAWSFYVRDPRESLLADQGSTSFRSHGTHGRLSDKEFVNAGRNSCVLPSHPEQGTLYNMWWWVVWQFCRVDNKRKTPSISCFNFISVLLIRGCFQYHQGHIDIGALSERCKETYGFLSTTNATFKYGPVNCYLSHNEDLRKVLS